MTPDWHAISLLLAGISLAGMSVSQIMLWRRVAKATTVVSASNGERRANDTPWGDTSRILAILYIIGYLGMVLALFVKEIPQGNRELILTVAGIMSSVQAAILAYYFGSSKAAEMTQRATEQRAARSESTMQEMVKAPVVAATLLAASKQAAEEVVQPWLTGKDYTNEQVVSPNGSGVAYVCIMPHTSGVFADDLAAGKWALKNP